MSEVNTHLTVRISCVRLNPLGIRRPTKIIAAAALRLSMLCAMLLTALLPLGSFAGIENSKHNMSISGPGTIKASSEDRICIFCHITHNALPIAPLWNRSNSGAAYTPYNSSTVVAKPGQPTGASLLCLSCHDGTIALGKVAIGDVIQMSGGTTTMPPGSRGLIGTDLSDDHPISFKFDNNLSTAAGELVDPSTLTGRVKLDSTGQLQCTSCHDPHNDTFGKFLVVDNRGSTLCETCHQKSDWPQSPHNNSRATWNGVGQDPWPNTNYNTVGDNGCSNCHSQHSALHPERLLSKLYEEDVCLGCHNNTVGPDVATDFSKISRHPVTDTFAVHAPGEPVLVNNRHVECVDCHGAHGSGTVVGPGGASGINLQGTIVSPVTATHQVCFRCHGDTQNTPLRTPRMIIQNNFREMFSTSNPAYHPVGGPGKNPNVPSLITPWNTNSTMTCGDCHASDSGLSNAPHGSSFSPILKLRYETADRTNESPQVYALCYSCHDRNSILGNNSFPEHNMHIVGQNTPCNVCHDPHGLSIAAGATATNVKLINFDTSVVSPSNGVIRHTSNGLFTGSCTLVCHGQNHNNETY